MKKGFIYILSNKNKTTLYIGVTSNLEGRILQHKCGVGSIFSTRYYLTELVYFEEFDDIESAIGREKQLKNWHRDWKWNLIRSSNQQLSDLAVEWYNAEELELFKRHNAF